MPPSQRPDFAGEKNIAVKVPRHADELEPLGDFPGHWISDPAGNILLVAQAGADSTLIPPSEG
jgi:hypothetical protein